MDANLLRQQQQQQQQQQQEMNSGLMRYRSAPTTLIASFMESEVEGCDDFIPSHHHQPHPPSSSPEAETMFARFMTCAAADPDLREIEDKFTSNKSSQFMNPIEHGSDCTSKYSPPNSQLMYRSQPPAPQPPPQQPMAENVYRVVDQEVKMSGGGGGGGNSNLIRHSSSPAGLFSHLSVENGYAVMRGIGNCRTGNGTNGEVAPTSRLKGQMNFSSGPTSSSGLMSQISEIESESMGASSPPDGGSLSNGTTSNRYIPNFPLASWEDPALENFSGLKRVRDVNSKMVSGLNSSETQSGEPGNRTTGLTHHYSLPKNSAEMAAILQFQDSVPCKIRAKRGCATHPRSIAERVRRTRISERMRKLQELVPNMDKQTNTADMLDLAVEYIKDLQKQVETLNDNRTNCTCSSKQKPY